MIPSRISQEEINTIIRNVATEKKKSGKSLAGVMMEIQTQWNNIAGETLAVHTYPYRIQSGELYVRCDHSIFAQQIHLYHQKIITALKIRVDAPVAKIKTTVGVIYWKNRDMGRKESDNISPDQKMAGNEPQISREIQKISDIIDEILKNIEKPGESNAQKGL